MGDRVRPGPGSPDTLVNRAIMLHERLTRQALMQLARSAVTAIASERPVLIAANSIMSNRLAR